MKTKFKLSNRILSVVLVLVMVVGLLPMTAVAATTPEAYDGRMAIPGIISSSNYRSFGLTDSNYSDYVGWYGIQNSKELYGFAYWINSVDNSASAVLLDDIVINETVSESGARYSWTPIGSDSNPFLGNFDGNGNTISGLYINSAEECVGLFGVYGDVYDGTNITIKNLTLANSYICGAANVGGIAGKINGCSATVSYCKIASDVTVRATSTGDANLGGIIGGFGQTVLAPGAACDIEHCVVLGKVDAPNAYNYIGAIIGFWKSENNAMDIVTVTNSYYIAGNTTKAGEVYDYGQGGEKYSDTGSIKLTSISDSHSCVSVTRKEIKATCEYTGSSEYSYCLICNTVISGTNEQYPIVDHSYSDATCKTLAKCIFCGVTKGNFAPDNHEGELTSCTKVDDENHKGIYSCCGITVTVPHSITGEATCIEAQKCTVCLSDIGSVDGDNHVSDEKIYRVSVSDRTKHDYQWNCCSLIISTESHSFDENHYCSTCGYTCEHLETNNGVCVDCGVSGVGYVHRYWDSLNNKVVSNNAIASVSDLISITSSTTAMTDGWYILEGDFTFSERITVSGTVNLILGDGYTLTANKGINVSSGNTLNIYGQIAETGRIVASMPSSDQNYATIGGGSCENCGTIMISSGTVEATGLRGAAIGGGFDGAEGNITINGGYVTAKNTGSGAAIGSGENSAGKTAGAVTINGGTVIASNTYYSANYAGAGIGGGYRGDGYTVMINGGNVKATSSKNAIGKGADNSGGSNGTLKDSKGNDVTLSTITLDSAEADTPVTAAEGINGYGLTCVKTLDANKLYFYLSSGASMPTSITAGGEEYICKSGSTYYTEHDWSQKDGECGRCGDICSHDEAGETCPVCGKSFHIHNWSYEAQDSDTIIALCTKNNCTLENANGGYITIAAPSSLIYTGSKIEAVIDNKLVTGDEITVDYSNEPINVGSYTASIALGGKTISVTYSISAMDVSGASIAVGESFTYDGTAKKPTDITVTLNGKSLTKDTDYTVSYSNNINAGSGKVIITGAGNYTGSASTTFTISNASLIEVKVQQIGTLIHNGKAQPPTVSTSAVSVNDQPVTFTYSTEQNGTYGSMPDFTDIGRYTVYYKATAPNHNEASGRFEVIMEWEPTEYATSVPNEKGWMNSDFVITANDGYKVSLTNTADGDWKDSLTYSGETADGSVTFYLKNETDGTIPLAKTITYKLDKTAPTGKVEFVERTGWEEFINTITFGLFYKDAVTVQATANDTLSGIDKIEYASADKAMTLEEVKAITDWTEYTDSFGVTLEDTKKFVYFVRITDNAGNVTYLSTDGAEYDTTAPVIEGVENGTTCYTTQKVTVTDKNIDSITLNGETAGNEIALEGNKEATYTIVATDKAGNETTVTVTMKPIKELAKATENLGNDNVTSADAPALKELVEKLNELIADPDTSDDGEKETLEQHKAIAESLLETIEAAAEAIDTENTEKVENVTPENVTPENKTDLEKAKADLEKALELGGVNYTEDEKKAIEDEIKRIDDALEVIGNVEAVEELIDKLPENITGNDEDAIKAADDAYNALFDYEKSLVEEAAKKALTDAKAALAELNKPADTNSPATGDNSNMLFWIALLFINGGAVITLTVVDRKRRSAAKK